MTTATYTFEVVPTGWDGVRLEGLKFEPFLIDVPALEVNDREHARAARRAYWTTMARLDGVAEPEEFEVFEWDASPGRGRRVGPGGLEAASCPYCAPDERCAIHAGDDEEAI